MSELNIVPIWIVTTLLCIMSYWHGRSINDFNVPKMDAQMIYLTVTDDKELKVESEDK